MVKTCLNCRKQVPDDAKFCMHCGYNFESNDNNDGTVGSLFSNGKIFLVIIAVVVIIGLIVIATTGNGDSNSETQIDDVEGVDLTITGVSGWDSSSGKKSYTLYTEAIFNSVPDDKDGYIVKTIYYNNNDTKIGQETEKLDEIYYDSDYALSFGHYTTYQLPDPDHVTVQIIKEGKIIQNFTEDIDVNQIEYLN